MECLFEDGDRRKDISWQQEFQDLPAAIGKLEVAKCPARAKHEYVVVCLISNRDLRASAGHNEVLPAGLVACLRVSGR